MGLGDVGLPPFLTISIASSMLMLNAGMAAAVLLKSPIFLGAVCP